MYSEFSKRTDFAIDKDIDSIIHKERLDNNVNIERIDFGIFRDKVFLDENMEDKILELSQMNSYTGLIVSKRPEYGHVEGMIVGNRKVIIPSNYDNERGIGVFYGELKKFCKHHNISFHLAEKVTNIVNTKTFGAQEKKVNIQEDKVNCFWINLNAILFFLKNPQSISDGIDAARSAGRIDSFVVSHTLADHINASKPWLANARFKEYISNVEGRPRSPKAINSHDVEKFTSFSPNDLKVKAFSLRDKWEGGRRVL